MAVRRALAASAVLLGCVAPCASQSVASCGGASDHLSNVNVVLSPDPIAKGQAFSFTLTGTMDEDHVGGTVDVDLQIKALGVLDEPVKTTLKYTLAPGLLKGPQKIVVGPVVMPSDPGSLEVVGQLRVTNLKAEPVACVKLNLNLPLMGSELPAVKGTEETKAVAAAEPHAVALCAKPTDHLNNIQVATAGGVSTVTANLDEALSGLTVNVDLSLKALFVRIPLKLTVPVSFSPALTPGAWKVVGSKVAAENEAASPVAVSGQVVLNDPKGEEITCFSVTPSEAKEAGDIVV